jgi:hypothetical protein
MLDFEQRTPLCPMPKSQRIIMRQSLILSHARQSPKAVQFNGSTLSEIPQEDPCMESPIRLYISVPLVHD